MVLYVDYILIKIFKRIRNPPLALNPPPAAVLSWRNGLVVLPLFIAPSLFSLLRWVSVPSPLRVLSPGSMTSKFFFPIQIQLSVYI